MHRTCTAAITYNVIMRDRAVEWPTVAVTAAIAGGLAATVALHEQLPAAVEIAALGVLAAWYNSLQHEVIHGHPTPWRADQHRHRHRPARPRRAVPPLPRPAPRPPPDARPHRSDADPESFYVTPQTWASAGPVHRWYLQRDAHAARAGWCSARRSSPRAGSPQACATRARRAGALRVVGHVAAVAVVLAVVRATGMSLWTYAIGVVWVGGALSLLRSFAEHRMTDAGPRSAIVRSGRFLSLLYLNNNLHHTHHVRPGVPWFQLPAADAELGADELVAAGAGLYTGYGDVARRYLLRPFDAPVQPAATMAVWTSSTTPAPTATA